MEFYDSALVVLNRPCGDPKCGLLHPEIVEFETIGAVVHEDEAMVAVIQKRGDMYLALVMEPYSIGYLPKDENKLCIVLSESIEREPLMINGPDLEELKKTIIHDAAYIHGVLFGRHDIQQDQPPSGTPVEIEGSSEEPIDDAIGLADLNPDKMHKA